MAPVIETRSETYFCSLFCMSLNARAANPTSAGPSSDRAAPCGSRPSWSAASAKRRSGRVIRVENTQAMGPMTAMPPTSQSVTRRSHSSSGPGWTTRHRPSGKRRAAANSLTSRVRVTVSVPAPAPPPPSGKKACGPGGPGIGSSPGRSAGDGGPPGPFGAAPFSGEPGGGGLLPSGPKSAGPPWPGGGPGCLGPGPWGPVERKDVMNTSCDGNRRTNRTSAVSAGMAPARTVETKASLRAIRSFGSFETSRTSSRRRDRPSTGLPARASATWARV